MNPSDAAVAFEAVKVSMMQSKDGVKVTFVIHPNDVPSSLFTDPVGARYQIAAVLLADDGTPIESEEKRDLQRLVTSAVMMCKEPRFQQWMFDVGHAMAVDEEETIIGLKNVLGIESRKELANNKTAAERYRQMLRNFDQGLVD